MKAGIVLDDWKLPVFRRRLTAAGFQYSDAGGLTINTTVLIVVTSDMAGLKKVIEAAQNECEKSKR